MAAGFTPAGGEHIAGVPAGFVAAPTSTTDTAAAISEAARNGWAIVVCGGGTKQDWALPPQRLDLILRTTGLRGVVEHAAGDLIVVVRAGTPLTELRAALASAGQQLALDPPMAMDDDMAAATVGGTVAVSTSGPRRMLYGTVRDLLIGVTLVRADGTIAKAGGKVVKNVAGYDLGKLVAGSYGTLAIITECAFRLHPLPAASAYVSRDVDSAREAGALAASVLGAQLVPSALEVDARPDGQYTIGMVLEGSVTGVAGRASGAAKLIGGARADEVPGWWARYPWRIGDVGLKLTCALSRVPDLLVVAHRWRGEGLHVRGSAGTGVLYAALPGSMDAGLAGTIVSDLRAAATAGAGHCVVLTAPPALRQRLDVWGHVDGLDLMRRVKEQFDPDGRLAPGRFVGGI